jgi:DNA transformation protein
MKKETDSFLAFVIDALSGVAGLRSRAMFGGHGLYSGEDFFGIVWKGTLFFRVDDTTRPLYEMKGASPFVYSRDGESMTMSYYEIPVDVLEDHEMLLAWAEAAITSSREAKKEKKKRA